MTEPKQQEALATILIVDDNATNLAFLYDLLVRENYRVLVAEDGASALQRAFQVRPDLIFLDAMMPGMDGFEVCRRLKENELTRSVPVVFATALTDEESRQLAMQLGAVDFISKPLIRRSTLACVERYLREGSRRSGEKSWLDAPPPASAGRFEPAKTVLSRALHDLRGSLGGARGFADALAEEWSQNRDEESMTSYIHWLRHSLLSMDETMHALMLQKNLPEYSWRWDEVPINRLLTDAAERVNDLFSHSHFDLEILGDTGKVAGEKFLLGELFFSLFRTIHNLREEREKSQVTAKVENGPGAHFRVTIRSSGRTLSPDEAKRFFTPATGSGSGAISGTGLALTTVQAVVQMMGAQGNVLPSADGNIFTINFPTPAVSP